MAEKMKWRLDDQTKGMYGPVVKVRLVSEWMTPEQADALRALIPDLPAEVG